MSSRTKSILAEVFRRRREEAAGEVARSFSSLESSRASADRAQRRFEKRALDRYEALRPTQGRWASREAAARRTQEKLNAIGKERDSAIDALRESRARMQASSLALARALALEKAARR